MRSNILKVAPETDGTRSFRSPARQWRVVGQAAAGRVNLTAGPRPSRAGRLDGADVGLSPAAAIDGRHGHLQRR